MKSKTRTLDGRFVASKLRSGALHLATGEVAGPEIVLTGTDASAAAMLAGSSFNQVTVDWRDGGVRIILASPKGSRVLSARNAVIHEPLTRLYESLPLATFDEAARRFWGRIFRLMRIPGGRYLLKLIARRPAPKN
jgi:hypothetical protein